MASSERNKPINFVRVVFSLKTNIPIRLAILSTPTLFTGKTIDPSNPAWSDSIISWILKKLGMPKTTPAIMLSILKVMA